MSSVDWSYTLKTVNINVHETMAERLDAAGQLQDFKPRCPVYVDTLKNEAAERYASWPDRLYIVLDSVVVYEGTFAAENYSLDEVYDWLNTHFRS